MKTNVKTKLIVTQTTQSYPNDLQQRLELFSELINETSEHDYDVVKDTNKLIRVIKKEEHGVFDFPQCNYDLLNTAGYYTRIQLIREKQFWSSVIAYIKKKVKLFDNLEQSFAEQLKGVNTKLMRNILILEHCVKGLTYKQVVEHTGMTGDKVRTAVFSTYFTILQKKRDKTINIDWLRRKSSMVLPVIEQYKSQLTN